ncbi:hypothetical protein [Brevibacterium linens]|uniref:hypothetical protein n=1 Tax=Brevibacterium linens TaxID=1703 RepID=UPI000FCA73C1|nr:hypothetical protein [Brevibacterium linens]
MRSRELPEVRRPAADAHPDADDRSAAVAAGPAVGDHRRANEHRSADSAPGEALLLFIVIPLIAAVLVRTLARRQPRVDRVVESAAKLMDPVMALTLLVITASVIPVIAGSAGHLGTAALVFAVFAVVMAVAGWILTRATQMAADQSRAVILSGVTRNSLVMLPLVRAITGERSGPAAVVTQTLTELIVLLILVRILPRLVPATAVSENR